MGLVTGTVQLSLAEVDSLRDQIKDRDVKVKELEAELVGVKADKRVMKVTKKVFASKHDYMMSFDERLFKSLMGTPPERIFEERHRFGGSFPYSMEDKVKVALTLHPIRNIAEDKDAVEFVNMDDVKQSIREDLSLKYEEEIRSLKDSQRYHADNMSSLRKEKDKAIEDLKYIIDEKDKAYEDLLMDKQEKSEIELYKEQLKKLVEQLDEERNKPWYKKLFK